MCETTLNNNFITRRVIAADKEGNCVLSKDVVIDFSKVSNGDTFQVTCKEAESLGAVIIHICYWHKVKKTYVIIDSYQLNQ